MERQQGRKEKGEELQGSTNPPQQQQADDVQHSASEEKKAGSTTPSELQRKYPVVSSKVIATEGWSNEVHSGTGESASNKKFNGYRKQRAAKRGPDHHQSTASSSPSPKSGKL